MQIKLKGKNIYANQQNKYDHCKWFRFPSYEVNIICKYITFICNNSKQVFTFKNPKNNGFNDMRLENYVKCSVTF